MCFGVGCDIRCFGVLIANMVPSLNANIFNDVSSRVLIRFRACCIFVIKGLQNVPISNFGCNFVKTPN